MADLHWVGAVVAAMVGEFSPVVPEMDWHNLNVAVETFFVETLGWEFFRFEAKRNGACMSEAMELEGV